MQTGRGVALALAGVLLVSLLAAWISRDEGTDAADGQAQDAEPEIPYCEHLVDPRLAHQVLVLVTTAPDKPPAPTAGVTVTATQAGQTVDSADTDAQGCASLVIHGEGAYVFRADYERSQGGQREFWESGNVNGRYDGESPGWLALELSSYGSVNWSAA